MPSILNRNLVTAVRERFALDWHGIHGAPHWARVRANGRAIVAHAGARTDVIELFSFLHDSCRANDGRDPAHGLRAVDFASELRGSRFDIDDAGFALLTEVCAKDLGHIDDVAVSRHSVYAVRASRVLLAGLGQRKALTLLDKEVIGRPSQEIVMRSIWE